MERLRGRFKLIVWIGILVNLVFVIGLCFFPVPLLELLSVRLDQPIWARAAGMLLFIISVFYIPATWDLDRYRANAWFHCFPSRTFGATFFTVAVLFFGFELGYLSIAIVDAVFGSAAFVTLLQITRMEQDEGRPVRLSVTTHSSNYAVSVPPAKDMTHDSITARS